MNVQKLLILTTLGLLLSACSAVKPVEVVKQEQGRTALGLAPPPPLDPKQVKFHVITPDNVEEVWQELREKNQDVVLFAITDDGYEKLALNLAELRNYIASQREIIIAYKEYYEPTPSEEEGGN
jgi:hypothetical protein